MPTEADWWLNRTFGVSLRDYSSISVAWTTLAWSINYSEILQDSPGVLAGCFRDSWKLLHFNRRAMRWILIDVNDFAGRCSSNSSFSGRINRRWNDPRRILWGDEEIAAHCWRVPGEYMASLSTFFHHSNQLNMSVITAVGSINALAIPWRPERSFKDSFQGPVNTAIAIACQTTRTI